MKQSLRIASLAAVAFFAFALPAWSAEATPSGIYLSGAIGAALTVIGAAYGISKIGAAALESMARQPEVAGQIGTSMIIAAALIEGVALFAIVECIIHGAPWPTAG